MQTVDSIDLAIARRTVRLLEHHGRSVSYAICRWRYEAVDVDFRRPISTPRFSAKGRASHEPHGDRQSVERDSSREKSSRDGSRTKCHVLIGTHALPASKHLFVRFISASDMGFEREVREAFPQLQEIEDVEMREKTVGVWVAGLEASEFDSLLDIPWVPGFIPMVGDEESQASHVRQVTDCCIAVAETLTQVRPGLDVDRDLLVAGALLHDVSKLHEIAEEAAAGDAEGYTPLNSYLPHPHYSVHQLAEAGFSVEMMNLVLAHTELSKVEPQSIEARLVESIDLLVTDATLWEHARQFRPDSDDAGELYYSNPED